MRYFRMVVLLACLVGVMHGVAVLTVAQHALPLGLLPAVGGLAVLLLADILATAATEG